MRPSLVNGAVITAAVFAVSLACSRADGRANAGTAASTATTVTPAVSAAASPVPAAAAPSMRAGTATDSLTKAADASRIEGSPSAPLWIIEVSDFQCPYCKQWHDEAYAMVRDNYVRTGKVRLAYVNFPLSMHPHAREAAIAAMCAGAQGKFWPMHDALFATQDRWGPPPSATRVLDSLALAVGANQAQYRACVAGPQIPALVAADQDRAQRGGVQSTPSFFVGSHLVEGAVPAAEMRTIIDSALAATHAQPQSGTTPR